MDQQTEEVLKTLSTIAMSVPMIKRMWVFGSRSKGTHKPDSDLDLAIEVEWLSGFGLGHNEDYISLWLSVLPYFKTEMNAACSWDLDLQNFVDEKVTPNIFNCVKKDGILIYEKPSSLLSKNS